MPDVHPERCRRGVAAAREREQYRGVIREHLSHNDTRGKSGVNSSKGRRGIEAIQALESALRGPGPRGGRMLIDPAILYSRGECRFAILKSQVRCKCGPAHSLLPGQITGVASQLVDGMHSHVEIPTDEPRMSGIGQNGEGLPKSGAGAAVIGSIEVEQAQGARG
jgi:hypothetical protein